ncbi:MAG: exo-alpha-sialidase [Bacteroidales bacterium]|nr:exo-alpha-sialidase [Bacteroidales bacterium]
MLKNGFGIFALAAFAAILLSCNGEIDPGMAPGGQQQGGGDNGAQTFTATIYRQNSEGYPVFRIPAMVTSTKGTLLCFCEGRATYDDNGNIDMVVKRSEDLGKSWGSLIKIADAGDDRYGNPVPVVLESGRILLVFGWSVASSASSSKVLCCFSDDDGKTWSAPVDITAQVKTSARSKYQTGPVHGIVKQLNPHKGRIIIPVYGTASDGKPSGVFYSDDNGDSWHPGGSINYSKGGEPTVTELGDGSIILNMRDKDDDPYRYQATSTDGGETWGEPYSTTLIEPGCQGALLTYDFGTSAQTTTLLFSNPTNTASRRHGAVKMSTNGGAVWKYSYQYTSDTGDGMYSSYSDLTVVKDDIIGIAYEAGYKNSAGILFKSIRIKEITALYTAQDK